jgi:hypothetical protein
MAGTHQMNATAAFLGSTVAANWRRLVLWGLAFAVLSQVAMLLALVLRFQALPNYVTFYDWPGNVLTIIRSTPSWSDIPPIVAEEWLIEIGRMNYDYGTGISEWSLNVIPSRLIVLFGLGVLVGLATSLMRSSECTRATTGAAAGLTGLGAGLVAMTNATMSWVVCCATPSWVVGLAMMGLSVSGSLALQRTGPVIGLIGTAMLVSLIFWLAYRRARANDETPSGETIHA